MAAALRGEVSPPDVSVLQTVSGARPLRPESDGRDGFPLHGRAVWRDHRPPASASVSRQVARRGVDLARGPSRDGFTEQETHLLTEIGGAVRARVGPRTAARGPSRSTRGARQFEALAEASDNLIGISDTEDRLGLRQSRMRSSGIEISERIWEMADGAQVDETVQDRDAPRVGDCGPLVGRRHRLGGGSSHSR